VVEFATLFIFLPLAFRLSWLRLQPICHHGDTSDAARKKGQRVHVALKFVFKECTWFLRWRLVC
ncbi:MAG TPA: hypothetical protein VNX22_07460, partial [Acidobacteriaceae bacterium]|nr:hypothetical protein [Acidobacteriaceae bacterium]